MKLVRFLLLSMLCAVASAAFAQLNIGTVDPGPYTPGSTIAATFTIDPATCITPGNVFRLRLSDASGNFAPGIVIGTFNSFYSTFVNGIIPVGTPAGTGYKVRVESSTPFLTTADSAPFEIKAGTAVEARLTSSSPLTNPNPEVFGRCEGSAGNQFFLTNGSTSTSTVTANVKNELTATASTLNFPTAIQSFNADLAHYTIFTKAVMPDGTIATKAYQLINNVVNTPFGTSGNNVVCLPLGQLEFNVIVDQAAGIKQNFPGNIYVVDWGDGTTSSHTMCDIIQNGEKVRHLYTQSSCGRMATGNVANAYDVRIRATNSYCGNIGTAVSSTAKVVVKPFNSFTFSPTACTNALISFTNTSTLGEDPNTATIGCQPNNVTYNWFVDGVPIEVGKPRSFVFTYTFTTHGVHTIRLTSTQTGVCSADPVEQQICIQDPPQPSFTLPIATICRGSSITPTNTSVIDNICNNTSSYSWLVSPAAGVTYGGGTNSSSPQPQFIFNSAGVYQIRLSITTPSCGLITSAPQTVVVNETPTATLSPNAALCSVNTYDFNPSTTGPTRTTFTGTSLDLADTYEWTVTGGAFNFIGGNQNTKYPKIQFLDYTTYTISVTHKNNCGSVTVTQTISFTPAPTVNAGGDQSICYNDVVNLNGLVTGAFLTTAWVNGTGTFSPNRNDVNAVYTPSAAERLAGQVTLTLRATTSLPSPCNVINDDIIITIKPSVTVNSPPTKSICTGTNVAYTPTSATAGATFAWTATGTPNASGFTASGTGNITDVLTNNSATTDATVTYIITPTGNGCLGVPFTLTVTVTPNPIVTPTAANLVICSGQSAGITLASNLVGTKYTWTSTSTAGITGNGSNATPTLSTSISDILFNNSTTAGTVDYIITPTSANGCPGAPFTITITVQPQPTTPNAGADESICNATSYTFKGNQPTVGTGLWTQVSSFPGVTFTNPDHFDGIANGLVPGNTYIFRWTITGAASCSPKTDDVSITVNPTSVGGTTTGTAAVCAGTNAGSITLSGHTGNILRWESSTDGGLTYPTIINNTTTTLNYTNLSTTTYYRAVVQSGICALTYSTAAIITVNQGVNISNAGLDQVLCNASSTMLNGNLPTPPNTGSWSLVSSQTGITFVDATLPNTIVNGLVAGQTYIFRWTISGSAPCPPSTDDVTVKIDLPSDGGITAGSTSVCAGNSNGQITVSGQVGNIVRWESSTDGFATSTIINTTQPFVAYTNLSTTTQYRAVVKSGSCNNALSTVATVTVNQGAVAANAGPDQDLCNVTSTILAGNDPLTNIGLWTLISGQTGVTFANASQFNTAVNGLVGGQTYIFRWTISGVAPCPASSDDVVINNLSALQNNTVATSAITNCTGQVITLVGSLPTGGSGTYTYVWQSSPTGTAPWTTIAGQTARDLNITVSASLSYQRIVTSGVCSATSNIITITALPPIANNTIATDQTICLTTTPNTITGSQPTGGDGTNYTYSWEQSIDNGNTWSVVPSISTPTYSPPAITQTTLYRRLVASSVCSGSSQSISNFVRITVNLNARAEFTYTNDLGCNPYLIDDNNIKAIPYPAQNATYTWYANGVIIGTGITFPGYTIATGNTSVVIRLVTTSSLGCLSDEMSHTFTTRPNVAASFTQSTAQGCGPLSVTFTNTTAITAGFTFEWRIDNTLVSTSADLGTLTFQTDPAGEDKIYNISLKVTTPCGSNTSASTVTVRPLPVAAFLPSTTNGCSPLSIVFKNTSPGSNTTYSYDFDDGTISPPTSSKADVSHTFITNVVRDYTVKMTATNECGTDTESIIIRVSPNTITPALIVNGNQLRGCAPFTVDFINNTRGASRFTYTFEPGVIVTANTVTTEVRPYTFTKAGTYTVTMVADNGCSTASAQVTIVVDPQPTISFKGDITSGCKGLTVKFTKTSTDAVSYVWDFGDGTSSNAAEPTHTYNGPARQYDVTLTAFNSLGCPTVLRLPNYITIVDPPNALFAISPAAVTSIPNYTFKFTDESTNEPQTYKWSFGDGDISSQRDPSHTYRDTGTYLVTMRTYNEFGCVDSLQKYVQIVGVPGYVYVPNSFIPGSTSSALQTFIALGSGMKSWKMQVFNKWGQVLWETTKLDDGKPIEGWDGNYKGVPQPQGIYFWKIEVELINGTEWKGMTFGKSAPKRTGEIYLIR